MYILMNVLYYSNCVFFCDFPHSSIHPCPNQLEERKQCQSQNNATQIFPFAHHQSVYSRYHLREFNRNFHNLMFCFFDSPPPFTYSSFFALLVPSLPFIIGELVILSLSLSPTSSHQSRTANANKYIHSLSLLLLLNSLLLFQSTPPNSSVIPKYLSPFSPFMFFVHNFSFFL